MSATVCRETRRQICDAGTVISKPRRRDNRLFFRTCWHDEIDDRIGTLLPLDPADGAGGGRAGCGTADYERRVKDFLDNQLVESVFTDLHEKPVPIAGTTVQLRIPKNITPQSAKAFNESSPDPSGVGKVDLRRVQPPFMKLPGLKATYEMNPPGDAGDPLCYYLYLGALAPGQAVPGGGTLANSLQEQLSTAFPASEPKPQWSDVECLTPSTARIVWKRIQASGDQEFSTGNAGEFKSAPGTIILYLYESQGQQVLIGWRVPKSLEKQAKADGLAKVMGGTVDLGAGTSAVACAGPHFPGECPSRDWASVAI